ncbi:HD domain-containing protein [Streptomyces sp. NPDC000410]|uniref:HD domain-containing protein n=1 Tax=Streptomyces sp. NPDC000410 TaxID=3154254 RepID=UPI003324A2A7
MAASDVLSRALHGPVDPPLRPLPPPVADLLHALNAPPRLAAHLRAVHDVALQLVEWAEQRCSYLGVDREAVLFGAATHDIGKTVHITELSGPGSSHEETGREILLAHGFGPELARFAATHAAWTDPEATLEDLLVSTADKVWKNKRVPELEDLVISRLAQAAGTQHWEEYLALDELLEHIGDGAEGRLAFQASFPAYTLSTAGDARRGRTPGSADACGSEARE